MQNLPKRISSSKPAKCYFRQNHIVNTPLIDTKPPATHAKSFQNHHHNAKCIQNTTHGHTENIFLFADWLLIE